MATRINHNQQFSSDAGMEINDRQIRIEGWGPDEQKKIQETPLLIIGDDTLGEITLAGALGLGSRNIMYLDANKNSNNKSFFSNVSKKGDRLERIIKTTANINPYSKISGYKAPFSEYFLNKESFNPEIIIDTTNNLVSKEKILNYISKHEGVDMISGISNQFSTEVLYHNKNIDNSSGILSPSFDVESLQGGFTSGIAAGVILEEYRKTIFKINDKEKNAEKRFLYNLESKLRNSNKFDNTLIDFGGNKNILIAGCGGIGTYAALGLAQEGFNNLYLLDNDSIEGTNLNRQLLYYDAIGLKKNQTLGTRLRRSFGINPTYVNGILDDKSGSFFENENIDLILGCFDNERARYLLSEYSRKYEIPYIDGGVSTSAATIYNYQPRRTSCVSCQGGFELKERVRQSCNDEPLPSVIFPNIISGSLMVGESIDYFSGNHNKNKLVYDSSAKNKLLSIASKKDVKYCMEKHSKQ